MRVRIGKRVYIPARIKLFDWILVVGLALAPMTGLRIWKVGPAEVLCLFWGIKGLFKGKLASNELNRFFFPFFGALLVGSLVGYFVAPQEQDVSGLAVWLYLGLTATLIYEGLRKNSLEYNEKLLFVLAQVGVLWYLFLFIYSRTVSMTFLGAPLWYSARRFSGGGTNPHQVAVFFCGIGFVFLRKALNGEHRLRCILFFVLSCYLLWCTESSTGKMAVALGVFTAVYFALAEVMPERKLVIRGVLAVSIIVIGVVGAAFWKSLFMDWVAEDKNGLGRFVIFASFPSAFIRSPVFGLGPGVHGINGSIEFHNMYLELLAATGLVGGAVFAVFTGRLMKKTLRADWSLFPILIALYAFGFAGFAVRRLIYWGLTAFVLVLSEQINARKTTLVE